MRKSRTLLDRYSLEKSYISFIRPLMEYADVIWDNQKQNLINKVENIKLNAVRIVTGGGTRLTSHDSLYEETK
jgi:uridine kinase